MKSILIISTSLHEEKSLAQAAFRAAVSDVKMTSTATFGQDAAWWDQNRPDVLVINLPDEKVLQKYFFDRMRTELPKDLPLITLCSSISGEMMGLSMQFKKIRVLKAPVGADVLFRNIQELWKEYSPDQQQIHPRYLTEQEISIASDTKQGSSIGVMRNLSLSGAYIEVPDNAMSLQPEDIIRIKVMIEVDKEYFFDARIVWFRQLPSATFGIGVTFVDKEEVFNNLLKGF